MHVGMMGSMASEAGALAQLRIETTALEPVNDTQRGNLDAQ